MQTYKSAGSLLAAAGLLLMPATLVAQSGDTDVGEASAFAGWTSGIGSHPAAGGSMGTVLSRYSMVLFEASYVPLGSYTMRRPPDEARVQDSHVYDLNVSLHIRIPVRERWAPYAIVGGGLLWNRYTSSVGDAQGIAMVSHNSHSGFGFHTGAGFRYYVGKNWGVRPEVRVTLSNPTYTRLSVGFFYVLPSNWL